MQVCSIALRFFMHAPSLSPAPTPAGDTRRYVDPGYVLDV